MGKKEDDMAFNYAKNRITDLEEKLRIAVELVRKGFKFSGHFSDCDELSDDEPCSCGANEFEHEAHIFLTKHDEIKAK